MQEGGDVDEQAIDDARLEMGLQPESEDGKHRFREIVRENIRTKFEKFRKWAKENLGEIAAIAISIAGIIATVVVAGKTCKIRTTNPSTYPKFTKYYPKLGSQRSRLLCPKFMDCSSPNCRSYIQIPTDETKEIKLYYNKI
jgi:hypothetical protein